MVTAGAERDYYIDKLNENGYVSVEFPVSGKDIDPLFGAFRDVLGEVYDEDGRVVKGGQDIIDAFKVEVPGRPGDGRGFIEQRRVGLVSTNEIGRDPGTDNKDQLHFLPWSEEQIYRRFLHRGGAPQSVRTLVRQCVELQQAVQTAVRPVTRALGVEDIMFAPKGMEDRNVHILRVIRYLGSAANEGVFIAPDPLAELHFDRSKFTAAVWESASGLVGTPGNNAFGNPNLSVEEFDAMAERALAHPISHISRQAKFFAGAGYNRLPHPLLPASGNVPLLLHGVTDDNPGAERDAVVMFMNQHAAGGMNDWVVAPKSETGFGNVRDAILERQERYGGLVAS
jgi:hypothetical protein